MTILVFLLNSVLFGAALAVDAFSVSVANAIRQPGMSLRRRCLIAGVFGGFQFFMPMAGWVCVRTIAGLFASFERWIPWIAAVLLGYIGIKMIVEGIRKSPEEEVSPVGHGQLFVQGVATSIDALSVGFAIADLSAVKALAESLIIGAVTFVICMAGLRLGKKIGAAFEARASILGGIVLILIGLNGLLRS